MTIENSVSIDFWSTFVNCYKRFRLPPNRCDNGDTRLKSCNYGLSLFYWLALTSFALGLRLDYSNSIVCMRTCMQLIEYFI